MKDSLEWKLCFLLFWDREKYFYCMSHLHVLWIECDACVLFCFFLGGSSVATHHGRERWVDVVNGLLNEKRQWPFAIKLFFVCFVPGSKSSQGPEKAQGEKMPFCKILWNWRSVSANIQEPVFCISTLIKLLLTESLCLLSKCLDQSGTAEAVPCPQRGDDQDK